MNREPPNKAMGFFGIYKEAFEITLSRKKIFLQISRSRLLPLTILFLCSMQLSYLFGYPLDISIFNAIMIVLSALLATSTVVYTVACICTSRDITFESVIGVFAKVGGRLVLTFLWCFLFWAIYTGLVVGFFIWFFLSMNAQGQGKDKLVLISGIFLLIPFVIGLICIENVMSVAMVISILEIDVYGWKALGKSMKLIRGKICVSFVVFLPLHIAIAGLVFAFTSLLVQEIVSLMSYMGIVRSFYVTIACSLLLMVLIHFTLVIQTIVYFVCKSYHNEDLSNFPEHLGDGYANLGGEQGDINELHRPLV